MLIMGETWMSINQHLVMYSGSIMAIYLRVARNKLV